LFREGELDEAIVELCSSLEVYPQYATGHSNLGFLYLWRGDLDQALASLLRALDLHPHHQEAPDHLMDVLRALTDELVQIGRTDGFLSTRPGGLFDERNRHRRARAIGTLVTTMGQRGVFKVDGRVLERERLMRFVIKEVEKKMERSWTSTALAFVWQDLDE
jgi:tetratricopeptide (TPR) repeat protein